MGIVPVIDENTPQQTTVGDPPVIEEGDTERRIAPSPFSVSEQRSSNMDRSHNPWRLETENPQRPQLLLSTGYVHSNWKKFSKKLNTGSIALDIGFERKIMGALEGGLHLTHISSASDGLANENVHSTHVALQLRLLLMPGKLRPFLGLGAGAGTYRVWSVDSHSKSAVTFTKHSSGAVFGAFPEIGLRFTTGRRMFFDLAGGYTGYIDHPKSRIGGANVMLRLGFRR